MYSADISPFCIQLKMGEGVQSGDHQEGISSSTCTQFDFSPTNLEHLQEDDQETFMCVCVVVCVFVCVCSCRCFSPQILTCSALTQILRPLFY